MRDSVTSLNYGLIEKLKLKFRDYIKKSDLT